MELDQLAQALVGLGCPAEKSAEMATQLGMRPLVAHCQFGLGELSKRRGDFAAAGETLRTAVALYGDLDMESWRQRAESALSSIT